MNGLLFLAVIGLLCLAGQAFGCYTCSYNCYICNAYRPSYTPFSSYQGNSAAASSASSSSTWGGFGNGGGGSSSSSSSSSSSGGGNGFYGSTYLFDVGGADASTIKDAQDACGAFMEQKTDKQISQKDMAKFIADKYYSNAKEQQENKDGLNPTTFHCCMKLYGNKIYKNKAEEKYVDPVLPKDSSCMKLTEALFKKVEAKKA